MEVVAHLVAILALPLWVLNDYASMDYCLVMINTAPVRHPFHPPFILFITNVRLIVQPTHVQH
jgi:hypothetical protein